MHAQRPRNKRDLVYVKDVHYRWSSSMREWSKEMGLSRKARTKSQRRVRSFVSHNNKTSFIGEIQGGQ